MIRLLTIAAVTAGALALGAGAASADEPQDPPNLLDAIVALDVEVGPIKFNLNNTVSGILGQQSDRPAARATPRASLETGLRRSR